MFSTYITKLLKLTETDRDFQIWNQDKLIWSMDCIFLVFRPVKALQTTCHTPIHTHYHTLMMVASMQGANLLI